jgi:hypothetical protein
MKNFGLPKTKVATGCTSVQTELTNFTGNASALRFTSMTTTPYGLRKTTTRFQSSLGTPLLALVTRGAGDSPNVRKPLVSAERLRVDLEKWKGDAVLKR